MYIKEIPNKVMILLQTKIEDNIFSVSAKVIDNSYGNGLKIAVDEEYDYLYDLLPAARHIDVAYVSSDNLYVIFQDVTVERLGTDALFTVSTDREGRFFDRRLYPRFAYDIKGQIKTNRQQNYDPCQIMNVSFYGLAVSSKRRIPIGEFCNVSFFDKLNRKPIELNGVIVNARIDNNRFVYGLHFSEEEDWEPLRKLCKSLQHEEFRMAVKDV